jgi:hypothetical protein
MKFRKKDGHGVKEVNSKLEPVSVSYSPYPLSSWMPVTHRRGRHSSSLSWTCIWPRSRSQGRVQWEQRMSSCVHSKMTEQIQDHVCGLPKGLNIKAMWLLLIFHFANHMRNVSITHAHLELCSERNSGKCNSSLNKWTHRKYNIYTQNYFAKWVISFPKHKAKSALTY